MEPLVSRMKRGQNRISSLRPSSASFASLGKNKNHRKIFLETFQKLIRISMAEKMKSPRFSSDLHQARDADSLVLASTTTVQVDEFF